VQDNAGTISPDADSHSATDINLDTTETNPKSNSESVIDRDLYGYEHKEGLELVKKMMAHAWKGYKTYAWGHDELKPISKTARDWMSNRGLAASLIDSLDTLYIMGMKTEFEEAVEYLLKDVDFDQDLDVSFFETTIRCLGGILSAYDLSKDQRLIPKAVDIADRLLKAFNSPSGLPYSKINLATGRGSFGWSSDLILAEVGSVQLEFGYLSDLTGNPVYKEKVT
jgi:mannosyl-oligosaccharide alpha-1,2-mannosidase